MSERARAHRGSIAVVAVLLGIALGVAAFVVISGVASGALEQLRWPAAAVMVGSFLGVAVIFWRVLGPPQELELPDAEEAGLRALAEIGDAKEIVQLTQALLWERSSWIIRRVERISFVDRTMVRRRVSVDFRVPAVLEIRLAEGTDLFGPELELLAGNPWSHLISNGGSTGSGNGDRTRDTVRSHDSPKGGEPPRYVPVSVLRSWPPVLNLDLSDRDGNPLPLLSKATTNALDSQLLLTLARDALGDYSDDLEDEILCIVYDDGILAQRAFLAFNAGVNKVLELEEQGQDIAISAASTSRLIDFARLLVHNTLLWVPVGEREGARTIVKLAYDEPVRRRLTPIGGFLTAFGLRSITVHVEVGQVGDAGSYHLEVDVPPSLELVDAELTISADDEPSTLRSRLRAGLRSRVQRIRLRSVQSVVNVEHAVARLLRINPPRSVVESRTLSNRLYTRRAHFYATGQRSRPALASLYLATERSGTPVATAVSTALVAVAMTLFESFARELFAHRTSPGVPGASVSLLLLAPGALSYVLVKGTEHPFATHALRGLRALALGAVLIVLAATATYTVAFTTADFRPLDEVVPWLTRASWILGCVALLGVALPPRRRSRRSD